MEWKVAQSCLTLCDPIDCSLPGSSIHGIFQARVLEWGAISFSRGSSRPRGWTRVSRIVGRRFTVWATREALYMQNMYTNKEPVDEGESGQSVWGVPTSPTKEGNLAIVNPFFSLISLPHSAPVQKAFYFAQLLGLLSICKTGCCPTQIDFCSNKLLKIVMCLSIS